MVEAGCFYVCYGHFLVIGFKDVQGMDVLGRLLCVVTFWLAFPFYEILQGLATPKVPVITDLLHSLPLCLQYLSLFLRTFPLVSP